MSYTTTSILGMKLAVPGSGQAFDTVQFNANLAAIDAGVGADRTRMGTIESAASTLSGKVNTLVANQIPVYCARDDTDSWPAFSVSTAVGTVTLPASPNKSRALTVDRANGGITIQQAGIYTISYGMQMAGTAQCLMMIGINGNRFIAGNASNEASSSSVSTIGIAALPLAKGDKITFYTQASTGQNTGTSFRHVSVALIGGL